ncbi:MAG: GAF domain-containing protein [Actinomycetes bacterium]
MPAPARPAEARHELIGNLARNVTARLDLGDVLSVTFAELRGIVRFTGGSIQLVDDDGWIRLAAADPVAADELYDLRIPIDSTVAGRIILTERAVYLPDITRELPQAPPKANLSPGGVRSYFGAPLLAEGRAIGVLQIDSVLADAWDDTERMLISCVAPIVAAAIQNARAQARVNAAHVSTRRTAQHARLMLRLLRGDIDASLRGIVEMSEHVPALRAEVDRLTTAIARLHAVAADIDPDFAPDDSLDLRTPQKTAP